MPGTSQISELLARVLRCGARAYAAYAARDLLATRTNNDEEGCTNTFSAWHTLIATRVEELAAAVAAERPDLFASQANWASQHFSVQGVSEVRFVAALSALGQVLATELPEKLRPVAMEYLGKAIDELAAPPAGHPVRLLPNTRYARLSLTYLLAVLEGDRNRASRVVLDAIDQPDSVRDIYRHVLLPAQVELGRMWMNGEINVAEEHFASYTTRMVMSQILSLATCELPNGKTVLTAAVAGNHVDIGLHAVADFFEMAGWQTIRLGADVPTVDLVESIDCFDVDLLALSVCLSVQLDTAKTVIEAVRSECRGHGPKIIVGGLAFADSGDLAVQIGADGYAPDPDEAVRLAGELLGLPSGHVAA